LERLLGNFDFDGAQAQLGECGSVIATDFFLGYLTTPTDFMEAARRFVFETYVRIHQKIDLPLLAGKLHMSEPAAEKWVVDLIRAASLDAKIDAKAHTVVMTVPTPSVHTQVIDKTRDLAQRTRVLAENVETAILEAGALAAAAAGAGAGDVQPQQQQSGGQGYYRGGGGGAGGGRGDRGDDRDRDGRGRRG
jgi:translation initiation factor 3 subunit E